jgi:hypothetical protein
MSSTLTWLDHDAAARDRSLRILALFREQETRDELGIGGIRDAIAEPLFPGTSTIQTRLRYMLFVPWIYQDLERQRRSLGFVPHPNRRCFNQTPADFSLLDFWCRSTSNLVSNATGGLLAYPQK